MISKEGDASVTSTIDCCTSTEYDFSDFIRENGSGLYSVTISAVASSENNENYKNAAQYGTSATSGQKRAVLVTPIYSTDDITAAAGNSKADKKVYVNENSQMDSYVVIAGESTVLNAKYDWAGTGIDGTTVYSTGYEVDSFTASTETGVTTGTATDNSLTGSFTGTVSITDDVTSSTINVILKLKKRAADGTVSITGDIDNYPYGSLEHNPYTADFVSSIEGIDYTYTYTWYYKLNGYTYKSGSSVKDVVKTIDDSGNVSTSENAIVWNDKTFTFPRGRQANTYNVYCDVTATRKDNGESVTKTATKDFTIYKATDGDPRYLILTVNSWDYGSARNPANCVPLFGKDMGTVTIYYSKKGENDWTTTVPTEVGSYEVYAHSSGTDSYPAVTSETKEFTINKVTLAEPENFTMVPVDNNHYGLLQWDAVTGYIENNGGAGSASRVSVSYEVKVYLNNSILGTEVVTGSELNVLNYINDEGHYKFTIQAFATDPSTNTVGNNNNCNDSEVVTLNTPIIGATVTTDIEGNSKEYDGESVTITAGYSDSSSSYEYVWYKDGAEITGATGKTYTISEVSDSGQYSVKVKSTNTGDEWVSSKTIQVTISPRPVKITGFSDSKDYDNLALSHAGTYTGDDLTGKYTISYAGTADSTQTALVKNAELVSLTYSGIITDAGTADNTPSGAVIRNSEGDKTSDYEIIYVPGTLTVNKIPATITAPSDSKVYDGTALTAPGIGTGVADDKKVTVTGLLTGHELSCVSMTTESTITDAGTKSNVIDTSSIEIIDTTDNSRDVSANYEFTKVDGTLTITKAEASISVSDAEYTYDGTAKSIAAAQMTGAGTFKEAKLQYALVTTDAEGTETVGTAKDSLSYVHAGVYKIQISLAESTNHAAATPVYATLTINKRPVAFKGITKSKEYDATPHSVTDTEYSVVSGSLADGDSISSIDVYNDGIIVNVGETENSHVKDAVIKNSAGNIVNDDYAVTYQDGELSFTKRNITVTAKDHTRKYDGTALEVSVPADVTSMSDENNYYYTVGSGELAGTDTISAITISGSQTLVGNTDAIPSAVQIKNGANDVTGNYNISYVPGTLTVTKRAISVTAKDQTREFDGTEFSCSGIFTPDQNMYEIGGDGLADGDTVETVSLVGSQFSVGESDITPSSLVIRHGSDDYTDNYEITYNKGKISVTKATVTVTAKEFSKVYDGNPLTYQGADFDTSKEAITVTGLMGSDQASDITLTGTVTNAGEVKLVASGLKITRGNTDVTDSYNIQYVDGKLAVTKRVITVTAGDSTGEYGNKFNAEGVTYTITGGNEISEGDAKIKLTCAVTEHSDIGDYDIIPKADSSNYEIIAVNGKYTVTKRPITIKADDRSSKYTPGMNLEQNKYTLTRGELVEGDKIESVSIEGRQMTVGSSINRPSNAVIKNGFRDVTGNYDITYEEGTLVVEKGEQEILAEDLTIEYDGQEHTISEIVKSLKYDDGSQIKVSVDEDTAITLDALNVTYTVAEDDLYAAATKTVTVKITKRPITITADSDSKTYDGTPLTKNSWSITSGSLADGDEISLDSLTVQADNSEGSLTEAGTVANKITGTAVIMDGDTDVSEYYEITYVNGKLTVNAKAEEETDDANDSSTEAASEESSNGISEESSNGNTEESSNGNTEESSSDNSKESSTDNNANAGGNDTEDVKDSSDTKKKDDIVSDDSGNGDSKKSGDSGSNKQADEIIQENGSEDSNTDNTSDNASGNNDEATRTSNAEKSEVVKDVTEEEKTGKTVSGTENESKSIIIKDTASDSEENSADNGNISKVQESDNNNTVIDYSKYVVGTKNSSGTSKSNETSTDTNSVTAPESEKDENIVDCEVVSADIERMINELLNKDEQASVAAGNDLRFRVEVKRDDEALTETIKKSVTESISSSYKIVGLFDTSLFVKIGDQEETLIEKAYSSVTVTFRIPDDIWDDSMIGHAKILRTYVNEDGEVVTEVVLSEVTGQNLVMDTDNYSTYTIVSDAVIAPEDIDCYIHWLILLMLIIIVLSILVYYHRRKKYAREEGFESEEERKKLRETAVRHYLLIILFNIIAAILYLFGSCHWDLIAELATIVSTVLVEMASKHNYNNYIKKLEYNSNQDDLIEKAQ
ncbi:MAG: hypothetical protein K6B41_12225 [Butyrivibrio sp.]|nr:hypothetical protein [Butyrivibrio sp.]